MRCAIHIHNIQFRLNYRRRLPKLGLKMLTVIAEFLKFDGSVEEHYLKRFLLALFYSELVWESMSIITKPILAAVPCL